MSSDRYRHYLQRILNDPATKDLCAEYKQLRGRYPPIYMDFLDGYEGTLADIIKSDIEHMKKNSVNQPKASNQ